MYEKHRNSYLFSRKSVMIVINILINKHAIFDPDGIERNLFPELPVANNI